MKQGKYSKKSGVQSNAAKGNVMTPLNWMAGISEAVFLFPGVYNYDNWYGIGCFFVAVSILIFYGKMYSHFAFKDPDRLQTEHYNLAAMQISRLETKSEEPKVLVRSSGQMTLFTDFDHEAIENQKIGEEK